MEEKNLEIIEQTEEVEEVLEEELDEELDAELDEEIEDLDNIDGDEDELGDEGDEELLEGKRDSVRDLENYRNAVKGIVIGSMSILAPVLAIGFGTSVLGFVIAAISLLCAVVSLLSCKKITKNPEPKTRELAKIAKTVSIIGLILSIAVLAFLVCYLLLSLIVLLFIGGGYLIMFILSIVLGFLSAV